jgi:hypothetical protein
MPMVVAALSETCTQHCGTAFESVWGCNVIIFFLYLFLPLQVQTLKQADPPSRKTFSYIHTRLRNLQNKIPWGTFACDAIKAEEEDIYKLISIGKQLKYSLCVLILLCYRRVSVL